MKAITKLSLLPLLFLAAFAGVALYGDPVLLTPQPVDVPAIAPEALAKLKNAPASMIAPEWLIAIGAALVEFGGRAMKTKKAFSIFYFLRDLFTYLGLVLGALGFQFDRVLQRTKDSQPNPKAKV